MGPSKSFLSKIVWFLKMQSVSGRRWELEGSRSSCPEWEWPTFCLKLKRKCVSNAAADESESGLVCCAIQEPVNTGIDRIFLCERMWVSAIFSGQLAVSFVFFNLYICPENVWWAGGGELTSSWRFTFDFWSAQKDQRWSFCHLFIHPFSTFYPCLHHGGGRLSKVAHNLCSQSPLNAC